MNGQSIKTEKKAISVRLPKKIFAELEKRAKKENRSMNSMIALFILNGIGSGLK